MLFNLLVFSTTVFLEVSSGKVNSLSVLSQSLGLLEEEFPDRKVQIVETAYHYQWQPPLGQGTIYDFSSQWPVSPEGQAAFAEDLIAFLVSVSEILYDYKIMMETDMPVTVTDITS